MPIFEYKCSECGTKFEKLVRNGSTAVACPSCGDERVNQELSTFATRSGGRTAEASMGGGCPSGMCQTPGLCGRN
ncbi:MAG TPA: zinc ribbon domain-containing protein [Bryobacteraceae bacterium]|jgi:putative FmdB family regulatory protein|nr:zinc ribbon domain-containing protein [Bryobacteraceae bacterium]